MKMGFVWHERYMWHEGAGHGASPVGGGPWMQPFGEVEGPEAKRRVRNLLEVGGVLDQLVSVAPRPATLDELAYLHTEEYITRIQRESAEDGGVAGAVTGFGPGSFEIAQLAVGGVIEAVDAVLDGTVDKAYALVRPPGHHALANEGRGLCIFGNVAIAVHHLKKVRGLSRVAVVDWDVHHGNGTQDAFYDDPSVLTISMHQANFQLGLTPGYVEERGEGDGLGANVNVPLPAGSGKGAYTAALDRVVAPALRAFKPEFIVLASGVDANILDISARMMLFSDAYREMTETLVGLADELCEGRLAAAHEGGYSETYSPFCCAATIEAMGGIRSEIEDPMLANPMYSANDQRLLPHQEDAITSISAALSD